MAGNNILLFRAETSVVSRREDLSFDIAEIEAIHGPNLYSKFLKKSGARPDPKQAAVIGTLLNARVKASDGSLQPKSKKIGVESGFCAENVQIERQHEREMHQLIGALNGLAKIAGADPHTIIDRCCPQLDAPSIHAYLRIAVDWLVRFDKEWESREKR